MDKEFLIENGVPEDKTEAILSKHEEGISNLVTEAKSVVKIDVKKENNETHAQYLSRVIKLDKDDAVSSVHNNYESTIEEVFGVKKQAGQKGTEFFKESFSTVKSEIEKGLTEKITEYEEKIKKNSNDPELVGKLQDEIQTVKGLLEEERKARENDKQEWEVANTKREKESMLRSVLPTFIDTLPKKTIDLTIKSEIDELMSIEGSEIVKDDNGEVIIRYGADQQYKTVKVSDIFADKFKGITKEDSPGGAGSGKKVHQNAKVLNISDEMKPHEVNNEIRRHLKENKGIDVGDNRYSEEFQKIKQEIRKG